MNQRQLKLLCNLKEDLDQLDYELLQDDELLLTILFKQENFLNNMNGLLTDLNELIREYELKLV